MTKVKNYAKHSNRKVRWACKGYNDWRDACIETNPDGCDKDIQRSDLQNPRELDKTMFCSVLCKFVTEVKSNRGEGYPPNTIREIIACIQMFWKTYKIQWRLLSEQDEVFADLYNVVDNSMKMRTAKGLGKVKHATPISLNQEEIMWQNGVLGEHTPQQLLETCWFALCIEGW